MLIIRALNAIQVTVYRPYMVMVHNYTPLCKEGIALIWAKVKG